MLLSVFSGTAAAANYATCLLDGMPGVQNDAAAASIAQACGQHYPGGMKNVPQGSGRSFFGYESGAQCAAKLAKDTLSQNGGRLIRYACNVLYDLPPPVFDFDPSTAVIVESPTSEIR
jgi:hypothetical protein